MSIDNEPRPGTPRTSTDESSLKLMLMKIVMQHVKHFIEPPKPSQENAQEPMCSLADRGCYNQKTLRLWARSVTSCALQSRHQSTRL